MKVTKITPSWLGMGQFLRKEQPKEKSQLNKKKTQAPQKKNNN